MSIAHLFGAVVGAAHAAIEALTALLTPVAGSLAAALAIILFTLLVRLAISPLTYLQARAGRRRAALAPHLAKLRAKHRDDPAKLAEQTLALHRENGVSPFAGLLPGLVQAPFFMVMYRVAWHAPAGAVLGVPLTAHLAAGLPVFAVLLVVAALLAWLSARRMRELPDQPAVLRLLPWLTVLTVGWLPLAGSLYLVTSTAWTAFESAIWRRPVLTGNS
jgi:YidC/Oxa1 family membrane protein insertase